MNDPQALEQALMLAKAQKINLQEVKRWSEKEGHKEKYADFISRIKNKKYSSGTSVLWHFLYVIMRAGFGKRDSADYLHDVLRGHILEI